MAKERIIKKNYSIREKWDSLRKKEKEFTWPEGKVLFDEIEDIFINHGYQSPLMYMHRSPGLLMVKAKAKRNRDGK
jgi:hypothetical protein